MINISPSLICFDPLNLEPELKFFHKYKISTLHIDIMDNNFVPRFGIYREIVDEIDKKFDFLLDLHFMVNDLSKSINDFIHFKKVKNISFHINPKNLEIVSSYLSTNIPIDKFSPICDLNTPVEKLCSIIKTFDFSKVLFMGIVPGVLNQIHQSDKMMKNIKDLQELIEKNLSVVQVDGGVNLQTIPQLLNLGVNDLVCGSSTIFKNTSGLDVDLKFKKILENLDLVKNAFRDI